MEPIKNVKVNSVSYSTKKREAAAGADYGVLMNTYKKIKDGWTDVDVIITMQAS
jgi:large subunit ribosomal protein L1